MNLLENVVLQQCSFIWGLCLGTVNFAHTYNSCSFSLVQGCHYLSIGYSVIRRHHSVNVEVAFVKLFIFRIPVRVGRNIEH